MGRKLTAIQCGVIITISSGSRNCLRMRESNDFDTDVSALKNSGRKRKFRFRQIEQCQDFNFTSTQFSGSSSEYVDTVIRSG